MDASALALPRGRRRVAGITPDSLIALLLAIAAQISLSALEAPFHRMFESSGGFFRGIARAHLEHGLTFTKGQDWIRNAENPYDWAGAEPDELRPYAHHPPGLGLSLALLFRMLGDTPGVARLGTVAMHLSGVLLLVLTLRRFAEPRLPFAAFFAGAFAAAAPIAGFFGRNVCHEAWVTPGLLLATAAYLPRLERGDKGTRREDAAICAGVACAAFFDWPGLYLPPFIVALEAVRGRLFGRLNRWLVASSAAVSLALVAQIFWAVGRDGLVMLADGARKRVSLGTYGLEAWPWAVKVAGFARDDFTGALLVTASVPLALGALRPLLGLTSRAHRRPIDGSTASPREPLRLDPLRTWIALWLALGGLHVVAFPSGSFVHPYWLWYLLPPLAAAGGLALAWLWRRRSWPRTVPSRIAALLVLVSFVCESRATLHSWFDVNRLATGNPILDRPLAPQLASICARCILPRLPEPGSTLLPEPAPPADAAAAPAPEAPTCETCGRRRFRRTAPDN